MVNQLKPNESTAVAELDRLRKMSSEQIGKDTFNCLLYGNPGTGKSHALSTLPRKPILIHSFDPHGTLPKPLRDMKESGDVITDVRFEEEDAKAPTALEAWEKEMERLRKSGVFDLIGSYCLDSLTTWSQAILNYLLKKKGRPGGKASLEDYLILLNTIRDWVKVITALPCDSVITAHILTEKCEVTGKITTTPMVSGKELKRLLPTLFCEMYVMTVQHTKDGTVRRFMTDGDGFLDAKTRIGSMVFEPYEEPDFGKLIAKSGWRAT